MSLSVPLSRPRLRGVHVLMMVAGFFAVVIAVDAGFAVMAWRTFPGEVSASPYEDGIAYNRELAQQAAQDRLGWRAQAGLDRIGSVVVAIRDRAGAPVRRLRLTGKLERPATEQGRRLLTFTETAPGTYVASAPGLAGAWDLSLTALGGPDERFEAQRRLMWP